MWWSESGHARETLAKLKADGIVGDDVELQVVTGNGWDQALDAADWLDSELVALGTSPRETIAGVPRLARFEDRAAQPGARACPTGLVSGSVLHHAAVDGDLTARQRGRAVAGQPRDYVGDLLRCLELHETLLALVIHRVQRHW
jgi:hypothetical protein